MGTQFAEALYLLANLSPYSDLWPQAVGSDQKDNVASTGDRNVVPLQTELTLHDSMRNSRIWECLDASSSNSRGVS